MFKKEKENLKNSLYENIDIPKKDNNNSKNLEEISPSNKNQEKKRNTTLPNKNKNSQSIIKPISKRKNTVNIKTDNNLKTFSPKVNSLSEINIENEIPKELENEQKIRNNIILNSNNFNSNNNPKKLLENKSRNKDKIDDDNRSKIMSTGKQRKNTEENNTLYNKFLLKIEKEKEKSSKKSKRAKTMNTSRSHCENTHKTTIICKNKNPTKKQINLKNKFLINANNNKNGNSNNEISFNNTNYNNRPNKKLDIAIKNSTNTLKKNNSESHHRFIKYKNDNRPLPYKFNRIFSQNNEFSDEDKNKETSIGDNDEKIDETQKNFAFSTEKKIKKKDWNNDPLNPYFINWQNSFLKIGYNVGFHYKEFQEGVPILRIQKLKKKVVLPPLYTVKYNKFTENKNATNEENIKNLVCSRVANKIFSPIKVNSNYPKNRTKNSFHHNFNFSKKEKNKENGPKLSPRSNNEQNINNNKEQNINLNSNVNSNDNNNNENKNQTFENNKVKNDEQIIDINNKDKNQDINLNNNEK